MAYSHSPFRFIQCSRTNCGRGYSGNGASSLTSAAHLVVNGAGCAFHSAANRSPDVRHQITKPIWNARLMIVTFRITTPIPDRNRLAQIQLSLPQDVHHEHWMRNTSCGDS